MNWNVVFDSRGIILNGLWVTVQLSAMGIVLGTVVGLFVALIRHARIPILSQAARIYVEIFRGSPLLLQLFFVFFGFPYLGLEVSPLEAALTALALYGGAYISEIFRAGMEAVPRGQYEAAQALGLSNYAIMRYVVLPQTFTVVLPPLIGFYIGLIKDTSLATIIGYQELMQQSQSIIDRTARPLEVYAVVAVLYFALCYPLSRLVTYLDRKRAIAL